MCSMQASSIGKAYTAITLVLDMSRQFQALGLLGRERAEADALHLAGDFELDLRGWRMLSMLGVRVKIACGVWLNMTYSLRHSYG